MGQIRRSFERSGSARAAGLARALRSLVVLAALASALAAGATAATLIDATFDDNGAEAVLMLKFDSEPPIKYTPLTDSRILILDFVQAVFAANKGKVAPRSNLVEYLSMAQFDRERLRLVIKVFPGTVVNVYRYPVPGQREVRFAVVVEREAALDRLPPLPGRKTRPRILFDPGHGGHDYGGMGTVTSDKEVALAVARELKKLFDRDRRVEVFFTRLSDHFVPLDTRTLIARRVEADVFVSLHANTMIRDSWTKGVEVWYLSEKGATREMRKVLDEKGIAPVTGRFSRRGAPTANVDQIILSMQQSKTVAQSSLLSRIINRNLQQWTRQESRGVKRANFRVLRPVEIPSCLVEFGFLSNPQEERLMASWAYARKAALAIYHGVLEWMARTGKLQGAAARGLIQAEVSTDEVGEEFRPGMESEADAERLRPGEGVNEPMFSRPRATPRPAVRPVPAPTRSVAPAEEEADPVTRARQRLERLRREGRD